VPAALLQAAIDRDPDAVAVLDRSLRFVAVNAAWRSATGFGEEALGLTLHDVFGLPSEAMKMALAPALAGREVVKTFKVAHDGPLRQTTITPWRDETGAIGGVITRDQVDDGRQRFDGRDRRLRVAMEMAKLSAYEIDFRTGAITYEPSMAGGAPGGLYCYDDAVGLLPEAQHAAQREAWATHLATGEPMLTEYSRVRAGGGLSWHRNLTEAVRGLDGEVVGMVGVTQIIDDQKKAELALVAEKEAAQAAHRAKSEFLANMSHEIRTPLTSVIGFADLLRKLDGLPPDAQIYVRRIAAAGHSLLSVINDILDFSKLESGQVELDPHPFDPAECVGAVVDLLAAQAAGKGIALALDVEADLPACLDADSSRIRQVLVNLVGNAVKFTAAGRVAVAVRYDGEAPGQLRIAVTDTGPGVAEDVRDRLFQRFSQVDGSVSRRHGGSGLGLAICKSLVELMGGTLGVESEPGRGSTFWFAVPAAPAAPPVEPEAASEGDAAGSRPVHILLVDDVSVNRELVRAMLAPFGHSFEEADNGADAVKAAMRSRFDLILMDMQMPGMDGAAATRAIRAAAEVNRGTPILAFSANVLAEHTAAAREAGMDDHIGKPIRPAELLAKVAMWTSPAGAPQGGVEAGSRARRAPNP
jgi:signal transduction histidine kinase/ActR/RegA family two-component response regulator